MFASQRGKDNNSMDIETYHLVIRFSDSRFRIEDVVDAHNEIVSNVGYVWFGKMGLPISVTKIDHLKQQIAIKRPTFVYLVKNFRMKSSFYKANILDITRQLPAIEVENFPNYYRQYDLINYIKTWLKISKVVPVNSEEIDNIKVVKSVFTLRETLSRSASGHFWVKKMKASN